ncbi:MAG: glycosyltransferase family 39 protein [Bacteroidota bacterium]
MLQGPILLLITGIYIYAWLMDAGIFYFESIKEPHGLWDAWNYWNLKAKFISRAPSQWSDLFQKVVSDDLHLDYPLLQTGYIAQCWLLMKNESLIVPMVFAFIITFCTIGLLSASVSFFTNKTKGLIAGLILLATPFYMTMGYSQYADNTAGFFYLATVVLLTFARRGASIKPNFLIAAGFAAGLSAWSKNEGLLFITCLFISQLTLLFFKNYRELLVDLKYILIGILPVLLLIAYYRIAIAPPNDIVNAQGAQTLVKLTDYSRYVTVCNWYVQQLSTFGQWILNPLWLFLIGFLYKGISLKENKNSLISTFILLLLMLIGFFFIYIITPLDLVFHLSTSIHRLFFQLFPTFIFIYFLAIKGKCTSKN